MEGLGIARKQAKRLESFRQRLNVILLIIMKDSLDSQSSRRNKIVFAVVDEKGFFGVDARKFQCAHEDLIARLVDTNLCRDDDGTEDRFQFLMPLQMIDPVFLVVCDDAYQARFLQL